VFNLGPSDITVDGISIQSEFQWEDSVTIKSWYDIFDHSAFSDGGSGDGLNGLLADSLIPLEHIFGLFSLEMILNLKDDLEKNEELYKNYESRWSTNKFSIGENIWMGPGAGLTFHQAFNFWQVFVQKYLEGDVDASLLEELERENKEKADIFIFDPDSCEIVEGVVVEEPCPPPCVPNPDATTIDWTTAPNEEPYLNEKVCEYWVPITTEYENVSERPATAIVNEQIEPGIKLILDFVGKESTDDIVLSLVSQITTDYFVDFRNRSKVKVLIKLPYDATTAIESKESKEADETTDSSEFPLNVVLTSKDIHSNGSMLNIVSRAIGNKYSEQYEILRYKRELSGLPQDIMLKKEGDRIRQFKKILIDLLKDQNFKFNPTRKKNRRS